MTSDYEVVAHYRHNRKGKLLVRCPSTDGLKNRAARLISSARGCKGRWVNRDKGYVMTPGAFQKFKKLYDAGTDCCVMTGKLYHD